MGRGRTTTNARTNPERGARDASRAQATASKSKARSADVSATGANLKEWNPKSWRQREALQQPNYENQAELEEALKVIANRPPLVFAGEARDLQEKLANAAAGNALSCSVVIVRKVLEISRRITCGIRTGFCCKCPSC